MTSDNHTDTINTNDDINDPAKSCRSAAEENYRSLVFIVGFQLRFLQLVVVSALLVLAVEWKPLHDFNVEHVWKLFIGSFVILLISTGLRFVKFTGRVILMHFGNLFFLTISLWFMAAMSFKLRILTPYCIVLCAVTETTTLLFLSVLTHFKKGTYKSYGIYGYAIIVPLMFLMLSQPYYILAHLKLGKGMIPENRLEDYSDSEEDHKLTMSYPVFMINVGLGVGLAVAMTFEIVFRLQRAVKKVEFRTGTGMLSGSITALANGEDIEAANVSPVNL